MASIELGNLTLAAVHLDDPAVEGAPTLHPAERRRAATLPAGRNRDRFVNGRTAIRLFAAELLQTRSDDLVIDYFCTNCGLSGPIDHGRPGYRTRRGGPKVRVSLSRSGAWCLLAGTIDSKVAAVGVDVEHTERVNFAGFDDLVLTGLERTLLNSVDGESGFRSMRARLWTRKEAFLKAKGTGLFRDPSTVEASDRFAEGIELVDIDPRILGLPAVLTAAAAIRLGG